MWSNEDLLYLWSYEGPLYLWSNEGLLYLWSNEGVLYLQFLLNWQVRCKGHIDQLGSVNCVSLCNRLSTQKSKRRIVCDWCQNRGKGMLMSHIEVWLDFACVNVHCKKCIDADVFIAFRLETQEFYMQKAKELKHIADKNVSWQEYMFSTLWWWTDYIYLMCHWCRKLGTSPL